MTNEIRELNDTALNTVTGGRSGDPSPGVLTGAELAKLESSPIWGGNPPKGPVPQRPFPSPGLAVA